MLSYVPTRILLIPTVLPYRTHHYTFFDAKAPKFPTDNIWRRFESGIKTDRRVAPPGMVVRCPNTWKPGDRANPGIGDGEGGNR